MISTNNAGGMECPSDIRLNVKTIVSPATAKCGGSFHDLWIIPMIQILILNYLILEYNQNCLLTVILGNGGL